ncbi:hypothetical protein ABEB36_008279 [Hypothenemus hampei]
MSKQRREQLLKENEEEDKNIKRLEKLLKLNKRKSKSIPKSFVDDGLDYLLEVCDPEYMKNITSTEQDLNDVNDTFGEDFELMTGKTKAESEEEFSQNEEGSDSLDDESDFGEEEEEPSDTGEDDHLIESNKRKLSTLDIEESVNKKRKNSTSDEESDKEDDKVWEDIYGKLRTKKGEILEDQQGKYIPPAIRAKMEGSTTEDKKRREKLERLKKQLKGLLNRLAESNMHNIANQIEQLYMNNSRNDMNETLTLLIMDSVIDKILTPDRLLMEHVLLITILHANVGTEVGAHFLQSVIKKFSDFIKISQNIEDKSLDNIVNVLAQLYNFKVFDAKLLYEILGKLSENFQEKNVECILHVLRNVGFSLRKDDPLELKNLILQLQKQAANASEGKMNNSRVKFLLDVLLAIKNNNVTKIPNYDISHSERLKKLMKGFIRKGNYVTPLNISLEDLLNADKRGKWWVVGSAWSGKSSNNTKEEKTTKIDSFSQQLLEIAKKQRMNTDTRRDVFCIIMSAEDYLDAFEKLLRLGLKNQQEREIINVLLHCCLQEKMFNQYYAFLAQKFCEYDRRFQMTIKCSVWDKLKTLNAHSGTQLSNLAKLLSHLFLQKGLPISTLKIVEFSELDKITLRLIRQILLGVLLHEDLEAVEGVFKNVALSDKLKMFRESLRLFIHHFLLRNLKEGMVSEEQKLRLESRAKMVEKILTVKETKTNW